MSVYFDFFRGLKSYRKEQVLLMKLIFVKHSSILKLIDE